MMNAILNSDDPPLKAALDTLVQEYGALRVVAALFARGLNRRVRVNRIRPEDLPDRIRADIGLPPEPRASKYWELR